jgi:hypothetical protein
VHDVDPVVEILPVAQGRHKFPARYVPAAQGAGVGARVGAGVGEPVGELVGQYGCPKRLKYESNVYFGGTT